MNCHKLTKTEYKHLSFKTQGYVSYMQGAWNKNVPNSCPYKFGTKEQKRWYEGQFSAMLEAQDSEE